MCTVLICESDAGLGEQRAQQWDTTIDVQSLDADVPPPGSKSCSGNGEQDSGLSRRFRNERDQFIYASPTILPAGRDNADERQVPVGLAEIRRSLRQEVHGSDLSTACAVSLDEFGETRNARL